MKKIFKSLEFYCIIGLLLCIGLFNFGQVRIENVVLHQDSGDKEISLPYSVEMEAKKHFNIGFDVSNPLNIRYDLNIIPDDCADFIVINGKDISLSDNPKKCSYSKGFWLQDSITSPYRVGKTTHYEIALRNKSGKAGLNVLYKSNSPFLLILKLLMPLLAGLLTIAIARRFKINKFLLLCILVGIFLRFAMFYSLPYTQFTMDVDGHVAYIQYIVENHSIPAADDCWTCYHPPVYYTSAAIPFWLGSITSIGSCSSVQAFSLALSVFLLVCGLLLLKEIISGAPLGVAAILWTVWPTLILVAPRIGNDQLFYAFHVLALLAGFNYIKKGFGKYLIIAVACAGLAMWTKSTGCVTIGLTILFTLIGFVKTNKLHRPTKTEIISWSLLFLIFAGIILEKFIGDNNLVGNIQSLNSHLIVGNEAKNYLFFDLKTFLTEPYTNAWDDELGRQYFLNYAFKTALFGEFKLVTTAFGKTIATIISLSFLGLLIYAIRGWWKTKLDVYHWILFIQGAVFFAALVFLRIKHPYSCSNDFRYILPVLLSFIPYVGLGIFQEDYSLKWKVTGTIVLIVFATCSVLLSGAIFLG